MDWEVVAGVAGGLGAGLAAGILMVRAGRPALPGWLGGPGRSGTGQRGAEARGTGQHGLETRGTGQHGLTTRGTGPDKPVGGPDPAEPSHRRTAIASHQPEPLADLGRKSLDSLRVGVVVLDPGDVPVLVNPAARAMGLLRVGATAGSVAAHPLIRTLAGQVRRTGVRREVELNLPRGREGGLQDSLGVHLRAMGLGAGFIAVEAADVTESHRVARVRRDFVANVSHELKTPIGALQLLAEALLDATDPGGAAGHGRAADASEAASEAADAGAAGGAADAGVAGGAADAGVAGGAADAGVAGGAADAGVAGGAADAGAVAAVRPPAEVAEDVAAARRFAERIQHESVRLGRLVNELLELTRLQGAEPLPVPEPVSVDWVIAEVVDRTRTAAAARRVAVTVEGTTGLTVYGSDSQVATAVANLVENAIAYSGEQTRVSVVTRRADDHIEIAVTDQGIGIAPNDVDRIFERFYRADQARSRSTGGTGLGLAIVKHIATNHGGRVVVSSTLGGGSTFTLRLPARPPDDVLPLPPSVEIEDGPSGVLSGETDQAEASPGLTKAEASPGLTKERN